MLDKCKYCANEAEPLPSHQICYGVCKQHQKRGTQDLRDHSMDYPMNCFSYECPCCHQQGTDMGWCYECDRFTVQLFPARQLFGKNINCEHQSTVFLSGPVTINYPDNYPYCFEKEPKESLLDRGLNKLVIFGQKHPNITVALFFSIFFMIVFVELLFASK